MLLQEILVLNVLLITAQCQNDDFVIPDVMLEAYQPKGFKATIPAMDGIQMFAFHGNLNKDITQIDPGQFSQDYTSPTDKHAWSYVNDDLELKVGDVINYWIFVQYNKLGYRKDAQKWTVSELLKKEERACEYSLSVVARKALICKKSVIFEDNFSSPNIDKNKWLIEEYIPYNSPDFEFVSYQNDETVCYINNNKLFIKPKPAQNEDEVRGELDLRSSCTRKDPDECYFSQNSVFIIPPVTSARLVSLVSFRYGTVEIKAKLPAGDWIYPQIYLEQVTDPEKKIWIAYSRGNKQLLAYSGDDVGGSLLFGGPVLQSQEPARTTYLKSKRNNNPFSNQMHIYSIIWSKERISLQVDGNEYGSIDAKTMQEIKFSEADTVKLVLGIGVGGVNDFPDNFKSGKEEKPWRNKERSQARKFFDAKEKWQSTWIGDNSALQVEYVKITSL